MTKNKVLIAAVVVVAVSLLVGAQFVSAASLSSKLKGRILLQVQQKGEAWYVNPVDLKKYYLGKPADMFDVMKKLGLGAKHEFITKYTVYPSYVFGRILLDVDDLGKAYYINPVNGKGYYLGKPDDALEVVRKLALGVTDVNLAQIVSAAGSPIIITTTDSGTVDLIKSSYKCKACKMNEKCVNGSCAAIALERKNVCGNFVCEAGESYDGKVAATLGKEYCPLDCSAACSGDYCNDYARIDCGCNEYDALAARHACIANAQKCSSCGTQASLFGEVLSIQTDVIKCLSDYFQYQPPRLIYKVFNNPNLDKCQNKEGCTGTEGGSGGADYVMFHNLNGFRAYGEVVPTKASYITADVHETTHYFLYQMLHGIPNWFHEAVAIQTNERLSCTSRQTTWGDNYLSEKENSDSGINMDDGNVLTYDYYRRLKKGEVSLSAKEKNDYYISATLFIMGLKDDYKCGAECFKDIVVKLREKEQNTCMIGSGENCAIVNYGVTWAMMWLGNGDKIGGELATNKVIKSTVEEVVGKSVSSLFDLTGIKY
jgi:hypothetical protein